MPFNLLDPDFLLALGLRSTLIFAAAFIATLLLRRASAAARHLVWTGAVLATLALPLLSVLPGWNVLPRWKVAPQAATLPTPPLPQPTNVNLDDASSNAAATRAPSPSIIAPTASPAWKLPSLAAILVGLWITGFAAALLPALAGRIALLRIERRAMVITEPPIRRMLDQAAADLQVHRGVTLLSGHSNTMPMAWGLWRARILLPREATEWPAAELRAVLLHELAHIKRQDCLIHLLAQISRAIYWPNPLAWLAVRAIHSERERACDDLVLNSGARSSEYASHLLDLAAGQRLFPAAAAAMAMARPSQLEHRIRSILDTQRSRSTMNRKQLFIGVGLALAVALPIAGIRTAMAQESQPEKQPDKKAERQWPPAPVEPALAMLKPGEETNYIRSANNMRRIILAMAVYWQKHDNMLPPTLSATLPYLVDKEEDAADPKAKYRFFLSPADQKTITVPEEPAPDWVDRNSSYIYLGSADVKVDDIADSATTAFIYEKMDRPYLVMHPDNTVHQWFCVGYPDGRVSWPSSREQAESAVAESRRTIEAMREGGAAPDDKQILWNLRQVAKAVDEYTKAHGGTLPPDLGSTIAYLPADAKRLGTPRQKASVYLSPAAWRAVKAPESPTAEWISKNTTYTYLGSGDLRMARIADPALTVLIYDDLSRGDSLKTANGEYTLIPFVQARGTVERWKRKSLEEGIEVSKAILEVARHGGTFPDLAQAVHDTQVLSAAICAYAKAHDDELPPDLGAVIPYLNADSLAGDTDTDRARVFLSPAAERKAAIPTLITPEWVNEHCNYVYLAGGGLKLKQVGRETMLLVHSPLDEELRSLPIYDNALTIALGDVGGHSHGWFLDGAKERIAGAKAAMDAMRATRSAR